MSIDQYRHLKQSITVSGFGSESIPSVLNGVDAIMTLFREKITGGNDIATPYETYSGGHKCFLAMNRCLTPISESDGIDELTIPANMDPTGRLRSAVGGEYVYTADNEVVYTEVITRGDDVRCEHFLLLRYTMFIS
jgi:hypothetical protein